MTHREVLAAAEDLGVGVVAFTDHDALPDQAVIEDLRSYDGPVKWTIGIELSSQVPQAVGGADKGSVHILGLFVDLANRELMQFCEAAEAGRLARMRRYVEHLRHLGFTISEADVMSQVPGKAVASPHMVKALKLHQENEAVNARMRLEFEKAAEHDEKLAAMLKQTLEDGPNQWPYTLYMGSGAWKPAPSVKSDNLRSYEETVKLIRQAGGVALAAHWYLEPDKMTQSDLEAVIKVGGLDGIEIEVENVINDRDLNEGAAQSRELVAQYDLLSTWGSDSHTRADLEAFVKSHVAKDSIGQTARLLEKVKPDLSWSRL